MVDHLIQGSLVSFRKTLWMACLGFSRFGSLSAVGRMAQNAVQAAATSFDDGAELVVCEGKGTQVGSGVGQKSSSSRKLIVLWCSFMTAAPRTTAYCRSRTIQNEMRNTLSIGENIIGIAQDPITSIGETPVLRGLAARRNPFLDGFMIDCTPRRFVSTVFVKNGDA